MAVNLSPIWGAGAQLLDNSGNVLSGGKIYTYAAGTTTPATTYTSSSGITANSNPIILNSAGRVPYEIWLTDTISYKFVLKDSNDTLIATYDNLIGINSNFIAYTSQQEIQTATAGQTVFNLTTMQYQPSTNSLSVFVDGVNQYGPGAQYAYVETDSDTVTFVNGLHVGASVKFTTAASVSSNYANAAQVTYDPPFTDAVVTNVEAKLAQYISVKDFGAVGDGVTNDTTAIQAALTAANLANLDCYLNAGTYVITGITLDEVNLYGPGKLFWSSATPIGTKMIVLQNGAKLDSISVDCNLSNLSSHTNYVTDATIYIEDDDSVITNCFIPGAPASIINGAKNVSNVIVSNNYFRNTPQRYGVLCRGSRWRITNNLFVGVLGYCIRVGLFGVDGVGDCANNIVTGNTVYASRSSAFHVELYANGTVIDGNTVQYTASAIKIQYQPGEPVYDTIVSNNIFRDTLYTGTWDDATSTWTPDTSSQWGVSGIGGYGTIVTGNVFDGVTGLHLYNKATVFIGNVIKNAGDNNIAIVRVQAEAEGSIIEGNQIQAADGYTSRFIRVDAPDVSVKSNVCSGGNNVLYLAEIYADNCVVEHNSFSDTLGTMLLGSVRKNTSYINNSFTNVTNPFSNVSALSNGTIIRENNNAGVIPDLRPIVNIDVSTTSVELTRSGKYRLGTGTDGVNSNLSTISGGQPNQVIILSRNSSLQNVTLVTGANISLAGGVSYLLTANFIGLIYNGSTWNELFRN